MANIQTTFGKDENDARSESCIAIDPRDRHRMVAASKKFRKLRGYDFTIATVYSVDGGRTWHDSGDLPLLSTWTGITDPTLTWDESGNVYLVGLVFHNPPDIDYIGIAAYKSVDGGATWRFSPDDEKKQPIHVDTSDDKQWVTADTNPKSPFAGRVYAAWDTSAGIVFARSLDHGDTWIGTGANPAGSVIATGSEYPEINVAHDGVIYVVARSSKDITMFVSFDGGDSFRPATNPATGITTVEAVFGSGGAGKFPGTTFRVYTMPTATAGMYGRVLVAWADCRENHARIYYALTLDAGVSWVTGVNGKPLLASGSIPREVHHFHPQIVMDPRGRIGCAFYELGATLLIDVILARSFDGGSTFPTRRVITDAPWDPAIDAPWARGNPAVTFIGEYFGLDANCVGFYPLWTDTRTKIQELFVDVDYSPVEFHSVYSQGDPGKGIDGYDLARPEDRAFAFDYDSSGKLDHLVLYRPGTGAISIVKNSGGTFVPVYAEGDPGTGIDGYDLARAEDRAFAFDYDSSGKLDHLVLYRPGTGAIYIVKNAGGKFVSVYAQGDPGKGIGEFDLLNSADRAFAFDYDSSGKLDHLVLYRPGSGAIFIVKNEGGKFVPVYAQPDPGKGIGGFDLLNPGDRAFAFDYDSSGKLDHLVLYRPGTGAIFIVKRIGASFVPIYAEHDPGSGIAGWDLKDPADRIFAYDFDSSGKMDALAIYRPGTRKIWILRHWGNFVPMFKSAAGIAGYDLAKADDRAFAYDYDSSGSRDHIVLYRPGTGAIYIVRKPPCRFVVD